MIAMSEQARGGSPSTAPGEPPRPDIDRKWVTSFTVQMCNQRATGDDISTALADVRAHCADTGQSPHEAFGDPRTYATTLAGELRPAPPPAVRQWSVRAVRQSSFSLIRGAVLLFPMGMGFAIAAIGLFSDADEVSVSIGQLLVIFVAVPSWVVGTMPWVRPRPRDPLAPHRRAFDENGWRGLFAVLGLVVVGAVLWIAFDYPVFTVTTWILSAVGWSLFLCGMIIHRLLTPRSPDPRRPPPSP
jgi:hypothetical protein